MKLRTAEPTKRFISQYAKSPGHAILLTGTQGIGLYTLAVHLAGSAGRLHSVVRPESKTPKSLPVIAVERIRELYVDTRARLDGVNVIIIDDADRMNHVAQNALLKLLEEPNDSFKFILTSHSPDKLLTTIRSRSQSFSVAPVEGLESRRLLTAMGIKDDLTLQRLLYVADGLPAELTRLVTNESDFKSLSERVIKAREFAQGSAYQRLCVVLSVSEDRAAALAFIETVNLLLRRSLETQPEKATLKIMAGLVDASDAIRANGNVKLQLASAAVT